MKNEFSLVITILCLVMSIILQTSKDEKAENIQPPSKKTTQTSKASYVKVFYEIEYGTIYTGNQTSVLYKGIDSLKITENGVGECGLPITGYFPTHSEVSFKIWNSPAKLLIACASNKPSGVLKISDYVNSFIMNTEVRKISASEILIKAYL